MKILFIKCFNPKGYSVAPPLGIMYLASFIRGKRRGKDEIRLYDMYVEGSNINNVLEVVKQFDPDIVGLSALTSEADCMHEVAQEIRKIKKDTLIVAGGHHPTGYKYKTIEDKNIDFVVVGEGEITFYELIEALENGYPKDKIPGLVVRKNGKVSFVPRELIWDLDIIPPPAWDMIDLEKYKNKRTQTPFRVRGLYATLFTSRGCPYRCIYCHTTFGKKFRAHSPQRVLNEIEDLVKRGVENFLIVDDIFNFDRKRMREILNGIIERKMKINLLFTGGLRLDLLDEEDIYLLKEAGTVYVGFGFETASERLQRLIKRNLKIPIVERNLKVMHKLRIFTAGGFIFGFPQESEEEMEKTLKWVLSNPVTTPLFFIANPYEGTELYKITKEKVKYESYSDFGHFLGKVIVSDIPPHKVAKMQLKAYIKFYFNPKKVVKIIRDYPYKKYYIIFDVFDFIKFIFSLFIKRLFMKKK